MRTLICLLLLLLCTTIGAQEPESAESAIATAMNRYDYRAAIDLINLVETPEAPLLYTKAKALKGLHKYAEAADVLKPIVTQQPENLVMLLELADCTRLAGKFDNALAMYQKVLGQNPEHTHARMQQINLLLSLSKFKEARTMCNEALAQDSSAINLRLMGQTYEGLLLPLSAIKCYEEVVRLEPGDYVTVSKLAGLYIGVDEMMNAIDLTEDFRRRDTTNLYVNRINAQAHCLAHNYDVALSRYQPIMAQGDSTFHTCYYSGISYYILKDFDEAVQCLKVARKFDPQNVNLLYYLGRACAQSEDHKAASIEYIEEALELSIPTNDALAKLYDGLTEAYKSNGQWQKYIETMLTLRKYEPEKNIILYRIGVAYQEGLKDLKNARKYLEMYMKTKPADLTESEPKRMDNGTVVLGPDVVYAAAEHRLEVIKKELFFRGELKEKEK